MRRIIRILIIGSLVLGLSSNLALAGPGLQGTIPGGNPVFLPLMSGGAGYQLKGRVVGLDDKGLAAVPVTDSQGRMALTDSQGYYTFSGLQSNTYAVAPRADGYSFYPSMASGMLPDQSQAPVFKAVAACASAIVNSSFEITSTDTTVTGWDLPITVYPARYTTTAFHTGARSVRTGIVNAADNIYSYSSVRTKEISIPSDTTSITLRFWLYPTSTEPLSKALPAQPATTELDKAPLESDVQYVMVIKPGATLVDDTRWETVYWSRSDDQFWSFHEFNLDVTKYAGKNIKIQLGTFNDGVGGITGMYVDDVTLDVCNAGTTPPPVITPTPGPTATPAPTPLPGACNERVANNSFETVSDWDIPATRFTAGYSTDQAHTGVQSMRTGIIFGAHNRFSYSDARQFVSIPSSSSTATLSLWVYQLTGETPAVYLPKPVAHGPFALQEVSKDIQYVLILDRYQNWIDTLLWQRQNTAAWTNYTFDLSNYIGKSIYIQFGTYNDGSDGVTSMYMDDVSLQACP
jgi:hypothetical protein